MVQELQTQISGFNTFSYDYPTNDNYNNANFLNSIYLYFENVNEEIPELYPYSVRLSDAFIKEYDELTTLSSNDVYKPLSIGKMIFGLTDIRATNNDNRIRLIANQIINSATNIGVNYDDLILQLPALKNFYNTTFSNTELLDKELDTISESITSILFDNLLNLDSLNDSDNELVLTKNYCDDKAGGLQFFLDEISGIIGQNILQLILMAKDWRFYGKGATIFSTKLNDSEILSGNIIPLLGANFVKQSGGYIAGSTPYGETIDKIGNLVNNNITMFNGGNKGISPDDIFYTKPHTHAINFNPDTSKLYIDENVGPFCPQLPYEGDYKSTYGVGSSERDCKAYWTNGKVDSIDPEETDDWKNWNCSSTDQLLSNRSKTFYRFSESEDGTLNNINGYISDYAGKKYLLSCNSNSFSASKTATSSITTIFSYPSGDNKYIGDDGTDLPKLKKSPPRFGTYVWKWV